MTLVGAVSLDCCLYEHGSNAGRALARKRHWKSSSVRRISETGVDAPEGGKLPVIGVTIPDGASDMNRTRWRWSLGGQVRIEQGSESM
jgi:hypothetical protein